MPDQPALAEDWLALGSMSSARRSGWTASASSSGSPWRRGARTLRASLCPSRQRPRSTYERGRSPRAASPVSRTHWQSCPLRVGQGPPFGLPRLKQSAQFRKNHRKAARLAVTNDHAGGCSRCRGAGGPRAGSARAFSRRAPARGPRIPRVRRPSDSAPCQVWTRDAPPLRASLSGGALVRPPDTPSVTKDSPKRRPRATPPRVVRNHLRSCPLGGRTEPPIRVPADHAFGQTAPPSAPGFTIALRASLLFWLSCRWSWLWRR